MRTMVVVVARVLDQDALEEPPADDQQRIKAHMGIGQAPPPVPTPASAVVVSESQWGEGRPRYCFR
jgi:hypothetical protein